MKGVWLLTREVLGVHLPEKTEHFAYSSLPVLLAEHPQFAKVSRQLYNGKVYLHLERSEHEMVSFRIERIPMIRPADVRP